MKIDKLKFFVDEMSTDSPLGKLTQSNTVYYYFDGKWHDTNGETNPAVAPISDLDRTRKSGLHWRHKRSNINYFPVKELDCVVVAQCSAATTVATRDLIQLSLSNSFRHAENAFRAAYDPLTDLYNREIFERRLKEHLKQPSLEARSAEVQQSSGRQLALLAFDLDHFKQVNDTHGHTYGDVVLIAFARRIETIAAGLEKRFAGRVAFHIARIGGEEFSIIEVGDLSDDEVCVVAEDFRLGISQVSLPSDSDWQAIQKEKSIHGLDIPSLGERKVTCSIGVVNIGIPVSEDAVNRVRSALINQADIALHKAKASDRNYLELYSDSIQEFKKVEGFYGEHYPARYYGIYAMCAYKCLTDKIEGVNIDIVKKLLLRAKAEPDNAFVQLADIDSALKVLEVT